jgi:hypothetical protein
MPPIFGGVKRAQLASPLTVALLLGCGGGGDGAASGPTPCPLPPAAGDERLLLEDLALEDHGVLAMTKKERGFIQARIVSEITIVELYPPIARSLLDNDYEILSGDNEGFEAEIFFRRGPGMNGNLYMREGPCKGQVTLTLTYEAPESKGRG